MGIYYVEIWNPKPRAGGITELWDFGAGWILEQLPNVTQGPSSLPGNHPAQGSPPGSASSIINRILLLIGRLPGPEITHAWLPALLLPTEACVQVALSSTPGSNPRPPPTNCGALGLTPTSCSSVSSSRKWGANVSDRVPARVASAGRGPWPVRPP